MVFVCRVTLQDHVIKALNAFMVRSPSQHTTRFGGHRYFGSGDIMISVYHVTFQDHVIRALYDFMVDFMI